MRRPRLGLRLRIALAVWVSTALALSVAGVLADASLRRSISEALGSAGAQTIPDVTVYPAALRRQMVIVALVGSTLAALGSWLVAGWIARPIRVAGEVASRFGAGELAARIPERGDDEVAVLAHQFNQMADSVTRMIDAQRHFISDTAHELRTPTAALVAAATALEEESTRDEAAVLVAPQLRRLSSLTEDLLALARFDSSREVLRTEEVDLVRLVQAAVRGIGEPGQVRVFALGHGRVAAEVDAVRVQTVVRNLVVNGLKHGAPPVTVLVQATGDGASITVVDEGPGVPLDKAESIFERFVRGDQARHGTGSGLGLAIARENARLHGGDLTLDEGGHGFRLTLPRTPRVEQGSGATVVLRRRRGWRESTVATLLVCGVAVAAWGSAQVLLPELSARGFGLVTPGMLDSLQAQYTWLGQPLFWLLRSGVSASLVGSFEVLALTVVLAFVLQGVTRLSRRRWPSALVVLTVASLYATVVWDWQLWWPAACLPALLVCVLVGPRPRPRSES